MPCSRSVCRPAASLKRDVDLLVLTMAVALLQRPRHDLLALRMARHRERTVASRYSWKWTYVDLPRHASRQSGNGATWACIAPVRDLSANVESWRNSSSKRPLTPARCASRSGSGYGVSRIYYYREALFLAVPLPGRGSPSSHPFWQYGSKNDGSSNLECSDTWSERVAARVGEDCN